MEEWNNVQRARQRSRASSDILSGGGRGVHSAPVGGVLTRASSRSGVFSDVDLVKVSKVQSVDEWDVGDEDMSKMFLAPSAGDGGAVRMSDGMAKMRLLEGS